MKRTRIKMCGMTRIEDVKTASQAGADALGFVFYPPSPRSISIETGKTLVAEKGIFTDVVTLFVNEDAGYIREVLQSMPVDYIQFHGNETPEFCQQFGLPYIKALRVKTADELKTQLDIHRDAPTILLDAYVKGVPGGTGEKFDWELIPHELASKLMLAGGLNVMNVHQAITSVRPFAVDVSGGIEESKGIKSAEKIMAFAQQVGQADQAFSEISS